MPSTLPRLYVIADAETLGRQDMSFRSFARQLHSAGVTLVQVRDKRATAATVTANLAILREEMPGATLYLNDRVDLAIQCGFDGVHLGQDDLAPEQASAACEEANARKRIGLSTHTQEQVLTAEFCNVNLDYVAVGPVFATQTKSDTEPEIGLEGLRKLRENTIHYVVAIGGITRENCRSVIEAGADSVAVISGLFAPGETVEEVARDFLRILR